MYSYFYFIKNNILYRSVINNGHKFDPAVIPEELTHTVLFLGHNLDTMVIRECMMQSNKSIAGKE